jgi:hypothetical protein
MSRQEQAQATAQSPASQQFWETIRGFQVSQLIHVAAKLGLADVPKDGPKSCNDLTQAVQAHLRALYRMLRMLASVDIFTEHMVTIGVIGRVVGQWGRPRAGLRVGAFAANVAFLCVLAGGCVTPAAVKDASTKHGNNLAGLQQAVGEYRRQLDGYYDRLIAGQREAHIAIHVNKAVKTIASDQAESIATEILKKPTSQKPAEDFIDAGASLADAFIFWGDDFNQWVEKTEGTTLADRRQSLRKQADELEARANQSATANQVDDLRKAAEKIRAEANRADDELTYVHIAIELKRQRSFLDTQLELLAAQVTTMQAFHAKVNEFLSIDATIDGAKIAAAAAAGSKANTAGILAK